MTSNRLVLAQYQQDWEEAGVPPCRHWENLFALFIRISSQLKLVFSGSPLNVGQTLFWSTCYKVFWGFSAAPDVAAWPTTAWSSHCCNFPQMTANEGVIPPHYAVSPSRQSRVTCRFAFLIFFFNPSFFCLFLSSIFSSRGWVSSSRGSIADFLISLAR